jgi:hypothetical protein
MRKPFKIMLGTIVGLMCLGAVLRVTGVTTDTPSTQETSSGESDAHPAASGWASSAEVFVQRWNSDIQDAYRISDLHVVKGGKDASLLGATVSAIDGQMYMLSTHNEEKFGPMCVATVKAALGVSADEATALVSQAHSNMQNGPMPAYGLVEYDGYNVSMQEFASSGEMDCTVMKKGS